MKWALAPVALLLAGCATPAPEAAPTVTNTIATTMTETVNAPAAPQDDTQLVSCQRAVFGLLGAVMALGEAMEAIDNIVKATSTQDGLDARTTRDMKVQSALDSKRSVDADIDACHG